MKKLFLFFNFLFITNFVFGQVFFNNSISGNLPSPIVVQTQISKIRLIINGPLYQIVQPILLTNGWGRIVKPHSIYVELLDENDNNICLVPTNFNREIIYNGIFLPRFRENLLLVNNSELIQAGQELNINWINATGQNEALVVIKAFSNKLNELLPLIPSEIFFNLLLEKFQNDLQNPINSFYD